MIYGVVATVVIGIVAAIGVGICAVRTALIAEENLQAFFHAHRATLEYIQQNDGEWPKSWDDLRAVRPDSDFDWVAEHVDFDFNADPVQIAKQTRDTFTAIVPDQPCYIIDDRIQVLIDVLAKHHGHTEDATEQTDGTRAGIGRAGSLRSVTSTPGRVILAVIGSDLPGMILRGRQAE